MLCFTQFQSRENKNCETCDLHTSQRSRISKTNHFHLSKGKSQYDIVENYNFHKFLALAATYRCNRTQSINYLIKIQRFCMFFLLFKSIYPTQTIKNFVEYQFESICQKPRKKTLKNCVIFFINVHSNKIEERKRDD